MRDPLEAPGAVLLKIYSPSSSKLLQVTGGILLGASYYNNSAASLIIRV